MSINEFSSLEQSFNKFLARKGEEMGPSKQVVCDLVEAVARHILKENQKTTEKEMKEVLTRQEFAKKYDFVCVTVLGYLVRLNPDADFHFKKGKQGYLYVQKTLDFLYNFTPHYRRCIEKMKNTQNKI